MLLLLQIMLVLSWILREKWKVISMKLYHNTTFMISFKLIFLSRWHHCSNFFMNLGSAITGPIGKECADLCQGLLVLPMLLSKSIRIINYSWFCFSDCKSNFVLRILLQDIFCLLEMWIHTMLSILFLVYLCPFIYSLLK